MNDTSRELVEQFIAFRKKAWEKNSPTIAVVATEELNPEDAEIVRQIVEANGYAGKERDEMIHKVSAMIIGRVEALADHMPADNGD